MTAKSVIITLATLFSTTLAQAKMNAIHLECQGSVDKSLKLIAQIALSGEGRLKIIYNNEGVVKAQRDLYLISTPDQNSDNYEFSTTTQEDSSKDQYTLRLRSHVVTSKLNGLTKDVKVLINRAYSGGDAIYGVVCNISQ